MRNFLLVLAAVVLALAIHGLAKASPLDCEGIKDPDQRNYCRAIAKNKKSYCEFIKDRDLRYKCRAMVR